MLPKPGEKAVKTEEGAEGKRERKKKDREIPSETRPKKAKKPKQDGGMSAVHPRPRPET